MSWETRASWIVALAPPENGMIRIEVGPLYPGSPLYTYRFVSDLPNPPMIEDKPECYESIEAAHEGAVTLLGRHVPIAGVYPRATMGLREAIGRAFMGLEAGEGQGLRTVLGWLSEAIGRQVDALVAAGEVALQDREAVVVALRYFTLTTIVGIPADFAPSSHMDTLPTVLVQQLSETGSVLSPLFSAELLRREGKLRGWECVRISPTEIHVTTQPCEGS